MTDTGSTNSNRRSFPYLWIVVGSLPAFLPLVQYWGDWSKYFYMGDEWAQFHQMDESGYWPWVFRFFGENFMPVFKLVWSAILFLGNGSYFLFVIIQFLLHAVVVFLLGYLLRLWGFSWFVVLFSQLVLALSHTHIEIMMQSIQMSNLLSYSFLLLLAIYASERALQDKGFSTRSCLIIGSLSLLGALSFSRGLLNGSSVAATFVLVGLFRKQPARLWLAPALPAFLPCLAIGLMTALAVFGKTGSSADGIPLTEVGRHYFYHLSLNPLYQQLRGVQLSPGLGLRLLVANMVLLALGLLCARERQRTLIIFFVFFFLGNGLLLSLGRSHMPIDTVASWRYQYGVLLCFAPIVAAIFDRLITFIPQPMIRLIPQLILIWWVSGRVYDHWKYHSPVWSDSRGTQIRAAADAKDIDPKAHAISGFSGVSDGRALELIEKYNLH